MRIPKVISESAQEFLTLAEVRLHCRVDAIGSPAEHADDPLLEALITVARESAEKFTGRSFVQRTLELALDSFPCGAIRLPRGPLQELLSIGYDAGDGQVALTDYQLD